MSNVTIDEHFELRAARKNMFAKQEPTDFWKLYRLLFALVVPSFTAICTDIAASSNLRFKQSQTCKMYNGAQQPLAVPDRADLQGATSRVLARAIPAPAAALQQAVTTLSATPVLVQLHGEPVYM